MSTHPIVDTGPGPVPASSPQPTTRDLTPWEWFLEATAARAAGDRQVALGFVRIALRGDAGAADPHILLAELLLETGGDKRQAMKALEAALALQPNHVEVLIRLAELYGSLGMTARASALLDRGRALRPTHRFFRQEGRRAAAAPPPQGTLGAQLRALVHRFLRPPG